jgi:hypothetical protein
MRSRQVVTLALALCFAGCDSDPSARNDAALDDGPIGADASVDARGDAPCSETSADGKVADSLVGQDGVSPEICGNKLDDDKDQATDCDDSDCFADASCVAVAIHVDKAGTDSGGCGAPASPCKTVKQGLSRATSGKTVYVHQGTYAELALAVPSGVRLYSADGRFKAKISSGASSAVRFTGVNNAEIDGFEIYGKLDAGSVDGDGLVRVHNTSKIIIRNCLVHDAGRDQDLIKVSGTVNGLLIERVIAYNPAKRVKPNPCGTSVSYQENIDIFGSAGTALNIIVRGCWLFQLGSVGDWLIYTKINAANVIYENNVFGPSAGGGCGNSAVGIGTGEAGQPDPKAYVVQHAIVRNNVFVGIKGDAALGVLNSNDVWVYGNTFYGNSGSTNRSVIVFRGNTRELGKVELFGNIFVNNHPSRKGGTLIWNRNKAPTPFFHDHNLFFNNVSSSDIVMSKEAHGIYKDPLLKAPAIPKTSVSSVAQILAIAATFALKSGSPAIDKAIDAVARVGHPSWQPAQTNRRWDILGQSRPAADTWDIGAVESSP